MRPRSPTRFSVCFVRYHDGLFRPLSEFSSARQPAQAASWRQSRIGGHDGTIFTNVIRSVYFPRAAGTFLGSLQIVSTIHNSLFVAAAGIARILARPASKTGNGLAVVPTYWSLFTPIAVDGDRPSAERPFYNQGYKIFKCCFGP
jgi:hypothetical protein